MKKLKGTHSKAAKASLKPAHSTEFSTENMLRDIKKVVKAFGKGIMKSPKDLKKSTKLASIRLPSDQLMSDDLGDREDDNETEESQSDVKLGDEEIPDSVEKKDKVKRVTGTIEATSHRQVSSADDTSSTGTTRVIFSNLNATPDAFESLIQEHVATCGPYEKCFLASRRKGVLVVANEGIANTYVEHLNGSKFNGELISVSVSTRNKKDGAKKTYMPSAETFKSLILQNVPKQVEPADLEKAINSVPGAVYKSMEKVEDGKWKFYFQSVPDCIKFNSLLNGYTLEFTVQNKSKKVKLKCEAPSFGTKTSHAGRVFVRNLPFNATTKQLEKVAHSLDKGATVHLPRGEKGGFAFIQFSNFQVAEKAIRLLNGSEFGGRTIRLTLALPTEIYSGKPKEAEGNAEDTVADNDESDNEHRDSDDDNQEESDEGDQPEDYDEEEGDNDDGDEEESDEGSTYSDDSAVTNNESVNDAREHTSTGRQTKKDEHLRTIFVRNLSYESTDAALRDYFGTFGDVEACNICKDAQGVSRGTAFVLFKTAEDARKILDMEEMALERDSEYGNTAANTAVHKPVKRSQAAGLGFSLNGRRLRLSMAVSRDEAKGLTNTRQEKSDTAHNLKKRTDLLMEGVITENSPEFQKLTPMQKKLQISSYKEKLEKMKNPNMFINPKRLCIRNLPNNVDVNALRLAIATHFRRNVDVKRICGMSKVDASRAIGKVTILADDKRKVVVEGTKIRRRKPFAFIDFKEEELALQALRFLSNNSEIFGPRHCLFAEFAIEDSRALYVQRKRKEQYHANLEEKLAEQKQHKGTPKLGERRKKRKTYSRGRLQRMKRRKMLESRTEQAQ
ncbi:RNA-binding protein 28 [Babesia sp. Xinjiang]|uniref:RNA-binding protein 28 n=1 Tax=Babesia sp. Xinjiang TaxID=462227 RepID=UPI000A2466E7|nr:RNA-binding protein 28 [Babesia sp. Xinjiang]ORM40283.1 RNA-binding protein 28 [Babesia sp. Xinjiang]